MELDGLLAALRRDPYDGAARRVLADWLRERGPPGAWRRHEARLAWARGLPERLGRLAEHVNVLLSGVDAPLVLEDLGTAPPDWPEWRAAAWIHSARPEVSSHWPPTSRRILPVGGGRTWRSDAVPGSIQLLEPLHVAFHPHQWLAARPEGGLSVLHVPPRDDPARWVGPAHAPPGPAPWDPDFVEAVGDLLARQPAGRLDESPLEGVLRGPDGAPTLLDLPARPDGPGWPEIERQLRTAAARPRAWAGGGARGPLRYLQEDAFGVHPDGVWVVLDGLGGWEGRWHHAAMVAALTEPGDPIARFRDALEALTRADERRSGGATAVRLEVARTGWTVAWIGDCRAYRIRGDQIRQLTVDHTLVQQLVERGDLTAAEARDHRLANICTRALSHVEPPELAQPDVIELNPERGDLVLLVSDGVWRSLGDDEILALVRAAGSLHDAIDLLLSAATRRSGTDNATAVLVRA